MNGLKHQVIIFISYATARGCDSVYASIITVSNVVTASQNKNICKGDSINVDGTWISEAMSFVTEDQTASGCDSITTISIAVDPIFDFTNSYSICEGDSILIQNEWIKASGNYLHSYATVRGCDSVYASIITVSNVVTASQSQNICKGDSINVDGTWISEAMSFVTEDQTASGCDSITTISIAVDPIFDFTNSYSICEGDSILIQNEWIK